MHSALVEHLVLGCSSSMLGLKIIEGFRAWTRNPAKPLRKILLLKFNGTMKTRWGHPKQSIKISSYINVFLLLSKWSIPCISSHPLNWCNRFGLIDLDWSLQLNLYNNALLLLRGSLPNMTSQNPVPAIFQSLHEPFRL